MKIVLLQTGKTAERYLAEGLTNYEERVRRYSSFETITLPDIRKTRNMPAEDQRAKEGAQMLRIFRDDDFIVILDDKGREFSTIEFSSWLERSLMIQKKRILFVIGGPWGFTEEIRGKADLTMSLSRMTFSHQMVRLLFLEQLYRAFTVIRGEPYHHE